MFFFFNDTSTTEIYTYLHTLSLHDALPIFEQHDEGQLAQALHHLDAPVDDLLGEVVLDRRLDATFKQVSAGGARRQAVDHRVVREQAEATNAQRVAEGLTALLLERHCTTVDVVQTGRAPGRERVDPYV